MRSRIGCKIIKCSNRVCRYLVVDYLHRSGKGVAVMVCKIYDHKMLRVYLCYPHSSVPSLPFTFTKSPVNHRRCIEDAVRYSILNIHIAIKANILCEVADCNVYQLVVVEQRALVPERHISGIGTHHSCYVDPLQSQLRIEGAMEPARCPYVNIPKGDSFHQIIEEHCIRGWIGWCWGNFYLQVAPLAGIAERNNHTPKNRPEGAVMELRIVALSLISPSSLNHKAIEIYWYVISRRGCSEATEEASIGS